MMQDLKSGSGSRVYLDAPRLRALVYDLSRQHERIGPVLLGVAVAGRALATNPASTTARQNASLAWRRLLEITGSPSTRDQDQEVLENANGLRLMPDAVARGMLEVCNRLKELEYQVSQIDFEQSPPELLARSGEAMRKFAATLDALELRVDQEVLPRIQQLLYEHGVAPRR
jgi:hypothetical protein